MGRFRKEATANTVSSITRTPPPTASVIDTAVSKPVSMLRCEGTRRHA